MARRSRSSTKDVRTFVGGLMQDAAGGMNFQPRPDKIEEGVFLKISPLLNFDGNAVDAKIDLTVNTVRMLHRTKVIAPREVGAVETTIDVPDTTQTHLEQTVRNWRLGQSLIISCGIHPGILDKKTGLFNLPIPVGGLRRDGSPRLPRCRYRRTGPRGEHTHSRRAAARNRRDDEDTAAVDRDQ